MTLREWDEGGFWGRFERIYANNKQLEDERRAVDDSEPLGLVGGAPRW